MEAGIVDLALEPCALELGHGGELGHVLAGDIAFDGGPGEGAKRLELGLEFSETEVDDLVVEDRLAEGLTFARVGDGLVDGLLQAREGAEGGVKALFLELHHLVGEAEAFLADAEALGHADVVEVDLRGVA